jgi:hypothetical protein
MYECLDVGLSYIQIMSTIFTFDDVYPAHSSNYKAVVTISDLINLNVDYVSPSCIIPSGVWRYHRPALCQRMVRSIRASIRQYSLEPDTFTQSTCVFLCWCSWSYSFWVLLVIPILPFLASCFAGGLAHLHYKVRGHKGKGTIFG